MPTSNVRTNRHRASLPGLLTLSLLGSMVLVQCGTKDAAVDRVLDATTTTVTADTSPATTPTTATTTIATSTTATSVPVEGGPDLATDPEWQPIAAALLRSTGLSPADVPVLRLTHVEAEGDDLLAVVELGPNPAGIQRVEVHGSDPRESGAVTRLVGVAESGWVSADLDPSGAVTRLAASDGSWLEFQPAGDATVVVVGATADGAIGPVTADLHPVAVAPGPAGLRLPASVAPASPRSAPPGTEPWPSSVSSAHRIPIVLAPEVAAGVVGELDVRATCTSSSADVTCQPYVTAGGTAVSVVSTYVARDPAPSVAVYRTRADCERVALMVASDAVLAGTVTGTLGLLASYVSAMGASAPIWVWAGGPISVVLGVLAVGAAVYYAAAAPDCGSVVTGQSVRDDLARQAQAAVVRVTITARSAVARVEPATVNVDVQPFLGGAWFGSRSPATLQPVTFTVSVDPVAVQIAVSITCVFEGKTSPVRNGVLSGSYDPLTAVFTVRSSTGSDVASATVVGGQVDISATGSQGTFFRMAGSLTYVPATRAVVGSGTVSEESVDAVSGKRSTCSGSWSIG